VEVIGMGSGGESMLVFELEFALARSWFGFLALEGSANWVGLVIITDGIRSGLKQVRLIMFSDWAVCKLVKRLFWVL
jgi:hypothetical protein